VTRTWSYIKGSRVRSTADSCYGSGQGGVPVRTTAQRSGVSVRIRKSTAQRSAGGGAAAAHTLVCSGRSVGGRARGGSRRRRAFCCEGGEDGGEDVGEVRQCTALHALGAARPRGELRECDEDPLPLRLAQAIVARRLAHHAAQCLHDAALGERGSAHVIHGEDGDQEDLAVASGARLVDERRQDARLQQLAQPRPVLRAARVREALPADVWP